MLTENESILVLLEQSLTLALDRMEIQKAIMQALEIRWDFGMVQLEQFFELHKSALDQGQSEYRLHMAATLERHSPELITRG